MQARCSITFPTTPGRLVTDPVDDLVLDLLEWLGLSARPYAEVMEAWRTSCPRLTVWEDANESGFLDRRSEPGRGPVVTVSALGRDYLRANRPAGAAAEAASPLAH